MGDGWWDSMGMNHKVCLPCYHWGDSPWDPCPKCGSTAHVATNLEARKKRLTEEIGVLRYELDKVEIALEEILAKR